MLLRVSPSIGCQGVVSQSVITRIQTRDDRPRREISGSCCPVQTSSKFKLVRFIRQKSFPMCAEAGGGGGFSSCRSVREIYQSRLPGSCGYYKSLAAAAMAAASAAVGWCPGGTTPPEVRVGGCSPGTSSTATRRWAREGSNTWRRSTYLLQGQLEVRYVLMCARLAGCAQVLRCSGVLRGQICCSTIRLNCARGARDI